MAGDDTKDRHQGESREDGHEVSTPLPRGRLAVSRSIGRTRAREKADTSRDQVASGRTETIETVFEIVERRSARPGPAAKRSTAP